MREVEGGSVLDIHILPCLRCENDFLTDMILKVGHFSVFYKRFHNTITKSFFLCVPVNLRLLVWHWDKDVNRRMALGSESRIRYAGISNIKRKVFRQHLVFEDILNVPLVIVGKKNRVMRKIINLVKAQVEHKGGAGVLFRINFLRAILLEGARGK